MKLLPSAARHVLITLGLVVGLVAALGGVAVAATPAATGVRLASVTSPLTSPLPSPATSPVQPTWSNDNWDHRDRHKSRDRDRDRHHKGSWNNPWRWKRWVVSPWQCRKGHGHVDWRHGRCWGGRFGGAWIRY